MDYINSDGATIQPSEDEVSWCHVLCMEVRYPWSNNTCTNHAATEGRNVCRFLGRANAATRSSTY